VQEKEESARRASRGGDGKGRRSGAARQWGSAFLEGGADDGGYSQSLKHIKTSTRSGQRGRGDDDDDDDDDDDEEEENRIRRSELRRRKTGGGGGGSGSRAAAKGGRGGSKGAKKASDSGSSLSEDEDEDEDEAQSSGAPCFAVTPDVYVHVCVCGGGGVFVCMRFLPREALACPPLFGIPRPCYLRSVHLTTPLSWS
jgi:hypothetical protein